MVGKLKSKLKDMNADSIMDGPENCPQIELSVGYAWVLGILDPRARHMDSLSFNVG